MIRKRLRHSQTQGNTATDEPNKLKQPMRKWDIILFVFMLIFISSAFYLTFCSYYFSKKKTCDVTKLANLPLSTPQYDQLVWGSYRPQQYFGLRNRHPLSPLFGLVWYKQPQRQIRSVALRHWCNNDDGVYFMWKDSDGETFGHQVIREEDNIHFDTDWFNNNSGTKDYSWSARIKLLETTNASLAFVFYFLLQDSETALNVLMQRAESNTYNIFQSESTIFGKFSLSMRGNYSDISFASYRFPEVFDSSMVNDAILNSLHWGYNNELQLKNRNKGTTADFVAVQVNVKERGSIEIHYNGPKRNDISFEDEYQSRLMRFRRNFSSRFSIDEYSDEMSNLGKSALSNLLGGIGYWSGYAIVRSDSFEGERLYGPLNLLSAVPSRSFFPRGFIWDEGFHNIVIAKFDSKKSLQIVCSWFDTMNEEGWIPREMILGTEAKAKVPAEFLVQSDTLANPPVFFILIENFLNDRQFVIENGKTLRSLYPRLKKWYNWLSVTQSGPKLGTFRWRGRNSTTNAELNPKTLSSGLDDYPRASHPIDAEYHLDLRCWMAVASRVLRMLAEQAGDVSFVPVIEKDVNILNDASLLDQLHWSEAVQRYADYGYHSTKVLLSKKIKRISSKSDQIIEYWTRDVLKPPEMSLVYDVNGYISLFPLLLKLIPFDSPKLDIILKNLDDPEELWSSYGLRSLSKRSPYYMRRNTEHDPPYWRGAIWINMNYFALNALSHYGNRNSGSSNYAKNRARELYARLRSNIINTVASEFRRTGYFWENYNDVTGYGQGTRPFTGWTSLILSILDNSEERENIK